MELEVVGAQARCCAVNWIMHCDGRDEAGM